MSQHLDLDVSGLYTDPNPHMAPDGALAQASNVVHRRPGILEPRPGIAQGPFHSACTTAPTSKRVRQIIPYAGTLYLSSQDTSTPGTFYVHEAPATGVTLCGNPYDYTTAMVRHAELGGALYLTSSLGIRKLVGAADTVAESSGLPRIGAFEADANNSNNVAVKWMTNNYSASYRVVAKRLDANAKLLRGPPSGIIVALNTTGTAAFVRLTVSLPQSDETGYELIAGDVIEVYRTAQVSGSEPGDEMQLVTEHVLTSAEVTAESCTIDDPCKDAARGVALYTNATQQGATQENAKPPYAKEIASYKGCLFFGWTKRNPLMQASMRDFADSTSLGWGYKPFTGDTHSNKTIDNISPADIAKLAVGQYIGDVNTPPTGIGANIDNFTKITVVGASSITVDTDSLATNVGAALYAGDVISLTDSSATIEYVSYSDDTGAGGGAFTFPANTAVADPRVCCESLVKQITANSTDFIATSLCVDVNDFRLQIESTSPAESISIDITSEAKWSFPNLAKPTAVAYTETVNEVAYSKQDQPESVPPLNYFRVGGEQDGILRLVPTQDALFIFKKDGTWILTGNSPSDFRVDEFDRSLILIHPESVAVLEGRIYAWTSRGVVSVSQNGVEDLSGPIDTSIADVQELFSAHPADGFGVWAFAHPVFGEYVLGLPATDDVLVSSLAYVYNSRTKSWTTWDVAFSCAAFNPADSKFYFGEGGSAFDFRGERNGTTAEFLCYPCCTQAITEPFNYDKTYCIQITAITVNAVTISVGSSGYIPVPGDGLRSGTTIVRITAVTDPTHVTVTDGSLLSTTGASSTTAYTAYSCVVEWSPVALRNPLIEKMFRDGALNFEDLTYTDRVAVAISTDKTTTPASQTLTVTADDDPIGMRFRVPRNMSRCTRIRPKVTIAQAASEFKLAGLSLVYDVISERFAR